MKRKRFTEANATFYQWRQKYGGMEAQAGVSRSTANGPAVAT